MVDLQIDGASLSATSSAANQGPQTVEARLPILLDPTGKILDFPMVMPQVGHRVTTG